jgi:hypothetical protein
MGRGCSTSPSSPGDPSPTRTPERPDRPWTEPEVKAYRDSLTREHRPEDEAYAFWLACPNPPNPASDENPYDSYNQPGGPSWDPRTQKLILPDTLRGLDHPGPRNRCPQRIIGLTLDDMAALQRLLPAEGQPMT